MLLRASQVKVSRPVAFRGASPMRALCLAIAACALARLAEAYTPKQSAASLSGRSAASASPPPHPSYAPPHPTGRHYPAVPPLPPSPPASPPPLTPPSVLTWSLTRIARRWGGRQPLRSSTAFSLNTTPRTSPGSGLPCSKKSSNNSLRGCRRVHGEVKVRVGL